MKKTKTCLVCPKFTDNILCAKHSRMTASLMGRERTRMYVRIRDDFRCQDCKRRRTPQFAKKNRLRLFDIHHINGLCGKKSRSYDRVSDMQNMITLCHSCHFNRPEHTVKNPMSRRWRADRNDRIKRDFQKGVRTVLIAKKHGLSTARIHHIVHGKKPWKAK